MKSICSGGPGEHICGWQQVNEFYSRALESEVRRASGCDGLPVLCADLWRLLLWNCYRADDYIDLLIIQLNVLPSPILPGRHLLCTIPIGCRWGIGKQKFEYVVNIGKCNMCYYTWNYYRLLVAKVVDHWNISPYILIFNVKSLLKVCCKL